MRTVKHALYFPVSFTSYQGRPDVKSNRANSSWAGTPKTGQPRTWEAQSAESGFRSLTSI